MNYHSFQHDVNIKRQKDNQIEIAVDDKNELVFTFDKRGIWCQSATIVACDYACSM